MNDRFRFRATSAATGLCLLLALGACTSPGRGPARDLLRGVDPQPLGPAVNAVIEIPAGTNAKWEVRKSDGRLEWEQRAGSPRVVNYAAYPGNYGLIPRSLLPEQEGGDGDPLDVIVLGPAVERGSVVRVRLLGVLKLVDDGERDDKLLAVRESGPLSDVSDLADLDRRFPGISLIVETWFSHYKGAGRLESRGFADQAEAQRILGAALAAYAAAHGAESAPQ
jgi:inorganic pyrophosphatase